MKKILTLFFLVIHIYCFAQNMGDIYVNENNSATISFDEKIDFVVFGNNPPLSDTRFQFYDFFTDGTVCVIRGNTPKAPKTSITIKLQNNDVWFGYICFGEYAKILYSFSSKSIKTNSETDIKENTSLQKDGPDNFIISNDKEINDNILKAKNLKREIFTVGQKIGDVEISINLIRNDKINSYFVFEINNKSGNAYIIDGILFKFIEGKRKGIKRDEASTEERLMPISILGTKNVKAYSSEIIGVAIPLFSVNNTGKAEISIREKDGTRSAKLTIKGNTLNKIKLLN